MRGRAVLVVLVALVFALIAVAANTPVSVSTGGRAFSAVPMHPGALQVLKAKGKLPRVPFPNSLNQGRKFAPGGNPIEPLDTAPTQKVLVIFVRFADAPPGGPAARLPLTYFDDMLFGEEYNPPEYGGTGPTDRTLYNYYQAVSYGAVTVTTDNPPSLLGWAAVNHPYSYYCPGNYGWGAFPANAQGLVRDAVLAVDPYVNFSQYAVDGEVPNLFVVHAGTGAEWNSDPNVIWSHSWSIPGGITVDGVTVRSYAMMPEVGGDLTNYLGYGVSGPYPPTVGVYAHEYGHVLGVPDQYDYGYESEGTSIYSLMAGGSWNQWPPDPIFAGNSPSFLDAWSRYRLGFVQPTEITGETQIELPPAELSPVVYKMVVPFSGGKEYFLFENRQQIGFDEGLNVYGSDAGQAVKGMAIYHVDDVVLNRSYWRPNEDENWKEWRSAGYKHYGISIMQADGLWDLEHGLYTRFTRDLYPGLLGVTSFGNFTSPNSSSYYFWGGNAPKFGYSGVTAENIAEADHTITATLKFTPPR